ncbi:hypothetical protein GGR57DRAFT_125474 [Xylariaceae sp. FL1272]|nr:hypothetical protein GGR57DRAFT_125474 [Xylariaceae sp. FL1272]
MSSAMASPNQAPAIPPTALEKFQDFDLKEVFDEATPHAVNFESRNFVVEFGPERARIAFNLDAEDIKKLIGSERDATYPVRWINIWDPCVQKDSLSIIGNHYGFSERLIGLMVLPSQDPHDNTVRHKDKATSATKQRQRLVDVETGAASSVSDGSMPLESLSSLQAMKGGAEVDDDGMLLYLQVKNTVNYFSTDQTQKALCIGAHWLHKRPKGNMEDRRKSMSMMPPKHWQWLALCNDHTVLSVHEKPCLETWPGEEDRAKLRQEELVNMRANTLDVLLQLSKEGFDLYKKKPLSLNSVRRPLSKLHSNTGVPPGLNRQETGMSSFATGGPADLADEGTSNLFYYLFEDYVAAGPLKTAEKKLEQMTTKVLENGRPKIRNKSADIIPTLHYLSKDLRELKHLFENYKNLINKVMANTQGATVEEPRRVMLTTSATSRFERLSDRLQFLMLNTIDGYLEEISALSSTYFNLTQQKDSEATARLTRSATLLAKLSVFFLPISFVTSYFSIQIEDLYSYWTGKDYWYSFAVIASVSFVSLFFFSRLLMFASDTLDEWASHISSFVRRLAQRTLGIKIGEEDED